MNTIELMDKINASVRDAHICDDIIEHLETKRADPSTIAQINSLRDEADAHTRRLRHLVYSAGLGPWAVGAAQSGDLKAWQLEPTDIEFPVTFRV